MDSIDQPQSAREYVFYARVWPRVKATLIDGVVLSGAFVVAAVIGGNVAGSGAVAFLAWVAFWILYDPLMVSGTGGTIGHHLQNLRVVSDRTDGNLSVVRAVVRNIVKSLLGILSLLAMMGSARQKALHDSIAGTTVQARDSRVALLRDFTKAPRPPARDRG